MSNNLKKFFKLLFLLTLLTVVLALPAFAANTDVSGGVTSAFNEYMKPQIKDIANKFIIPIACGIDLIALIVKSIMAYSNYKRNGGQYEWHALAVMGGCLVIGVTAPLWMWGLIGW